MGFFKKAFKAAISPLTFTAANAKTVVGATKSILSGDTDTAFDQLKGGYKNSFKAAAEDSSYGLIKTATNDKQQAQDVAMPEAKTPDQLAAEEQTAVAEQYKNSILNRNKGRYNNSLLGGGYF